MTTFWRLRLRRSAFLLSLCLLPLVRAQDPFDCRVALDDGKRKFDLTSLAGEKAMSYTRETPPTVTINDVRFNLCADLQKREGVSDTDQCPQGTRACLTMINQKGDNSDRIIAAIPLAVSSDLKPETRALSSPKGLELVFHGSEYPKVDAIPQSFNISILCATEQSEPKYVSYFGRELLVEWSAPAGCDFQGDAPPPGNGGEKDEGGNKPDEHVGSGVGWFFLVVLLAFAAYFGLGAYYNYSTYGATGADLIPHRDFWRDVPYILRDIVAHLCSAIRPSRSGYITV